MNQEGIVRARVVLKNIGHIITRMKERELARRQLYYHIDRLHQKPSKTALSKLPSLVEEVVSKERNLARRGMYESERIRILTKQLSELSFQNANLESQVRSLKTSPPKQIFPDNKKGKVLLQKRIERIELKLENAKSQLSKQEIKSIKEKINGLKKQLKDL